jgi:hypothetical protein
LCAPHIKRALALTKLASGFGFIDKKKRTRE